MAEFVLVAGAWLGSRAWDEVVSELRTAGHGTHPVTLSGLAEKQGVQAGQQTHVRDIVDEVERHDLHDVVLVGHSYSGIPVGQAAERIGDRLARVVFVDSEIPVDGESFASGWWAYREALEASIAGNGGFWAPLTTADFDGQGLTDEQIARIVGGSTPHPGTTLTEAGRTGTPARRASGDLHQVPARRRRAERRRGQAAGGQRALGPGRDGHRPLADVLPAARAGTDPAPVGRGILSPGPACPGPGGSPGPG